VAGRQTKRLLLNQQLADGGDQNEYGLGRKGVAVDPVMVKDPGQCVALRPAEPIGTGSQFIADDFALVGQYGELPRKRGTGGVRVEGPQRPKWPALSYLARYEWQVAARPGRLRQAGPSVRRAPALGSGVLDVFSGTLFEIDGGSGLVDAASGLLQQPEEGAVGA